MSTVLNIYHRLPNASRSAIASLRGYYLNWWRYDRLTEKLVDGALEREMWNAREWANWRSERLGYVLERAATRVPYYKRYWAERRRRGDRTSWSYLENWPILEKEVLRANSKDFVADDRNPSKMFRDHTSGTTGTSLDLWLTRDTVKQWYALFEARSRRWYGLSRRDKWAILGGQLVTPARQTMPPFWVWNAGLNQLYLSSYHLAPIWIPAYLDAIITYRVRYILGYPSAIYALAVEALKLGRKDVVLDVVISNAEPLYDYQREAIGKAFSCPVRETYGMAEIVAAAGECEHGSLHQWPEAGIIESLHFEEDESHAFICTGLMNSDMPLIRYRVGDSGKMSSKICSCGRTLPVIDTVEGRSDDLLWTADGRRVGRLDPVFKGNLPIIEAQIIQEAISAIRVLYVPAENFSMATLDSVYERIRERLGEVNITFSEVVSIPRTNRGKFRAVICNLSEKEKLSAGMGRVGSFT